MYSNIFDWGLQCCLCLKNLLHDVIHLEHKMLCEIHKAALSTCDMHRLLGWEQFATAVLGCQSLGSLQLDQIRCSYSLSYKAVLVRTIIQVSQKYIFCWKILEPALVLPTSLPILQQHLRISKCDIFFPSEKNQICDNFEGSFQRRSYREITSFWWHEGVQPQSETV